MQWLWLISAAIMLSGCITSGKRGSGEVMVVYDLGLVSSATTFTGLVGPAALEVRAPSWFDSPGIQYRLTYIDASRLREYREARWAAPPAQLIQQRLIQQLSLNTVGQSKALCVLRIELGEFSQVFSSPDISKGILYGRAQWLDRTRNVLGELPLDIEIEAPSADARGGVVAMQRTVAQLAKELHAWQKSQHFSGKNSGCGPIIEK